MEVRKMAHAAHTILLLEDDRAISKLLSSVLQRQGYAVLEASNGSEAIRIGQLCRVYAGCGTR
jgi:DNA-binding response OmpR family regulator